MKTYQKQYTIIEVEMRFQNFKASLKRIEERNAKSTGAVFFWHKQIE